MQKKIIILSILIQLKKKEIKIKFQNGLSFEDFKKDVFEIHGLLEKFDFIESKQPDFIGFGPYGNDIPPKGNYKRIGYFCENIKPDFSICDWAFGMPSEHIINRANYSKIQWHGFNPNRLIKTISENEIDQIVEKKRKFCNFLYSNRVPYREEFFKQLSKYKKIDAPSRSMNNMPSIDSMYDGDVWERKRKFLDPYKFTIAFENYSYPGYHTEKLFDSMLTNSLPIYCGDPDINEKFDTSSFINTHEYIDFDYGKIVRFIEQVSQWDFVDIRPSFYNNPLHKVSRKLKTFGRELKMRIQYNHLDFKNVIERIIEIDENIDLYVAHLRKPWFHQNKIPFQAHSTAIWSDIFNS